MPAVPPSLPCKNVEAALATANHAKEVCNSAKRGGFAAVYIYEYTPGALTHTQENKPHTPSLPSDSHTKSLFSLEVMSMILAYKAACEKFSKEERVLASTLVALMPVSAPRVSSLFFLLSCLFSFTLCVCASSTCSNAFPSLSRSLNPDYTSPVSLNLCKIKPHRLFIRHPIYYIQYII